MHGVAELPEPQVGVRQSRVQGLGRGDCNEAFTVQPAEKNGRPHACHSTNSIISISLQPAVFLTSSAPPLLNRDRGQGVKYHAISNDTSPISATRRSGIGSPLNPPEIHPLRIAMMVSGAGINGAIIHTLLLTRYLARRGHKVLLLHRPDAWIARQSGLNEVELFETSFGRSPRELIRVTRRINRLWRRGGPHAYEQRPQLRHAHAHPQPPARGRHRAFAVNPIALALQQHRHRDLSRRGRTSSPAQSRRPLGAAAAAQLHRDDEVSADNGKPAQGRARGVRLRRRRLRDRLGGLHRRPQEPARSCASAWRRRSQGAAGTAAAGRRRRPGLWRGNQTHGRTAGRERAHRLHRTASRTFPICWRRWTCSRWCRARRPARSRCWRRCPRGCRCSRPMSACCPISFATASPDISSMSATSPAIADRLTAMALEPERRQAMGEAAQKIVRDEYDIEIAGPRIEAMLAEAAQIRNRPLLGFVAGCAGNDRSRIAKRPSRGIHCAYPLRP